VYLLAVRRYMTGMQLVTVSTGADCYKTTSEWPQMSLAVNMSVLAGIGVIYHRIIHVI